MQCLVLFLGSSSVCHLRALVQEGLGLDLCLSVVTFSRLSVFQQNRNNGLGGRAVYDPYLQVLSSNGKNQEQPESAGGLPGQWKRELAVKPRLNLLFLVCFSTCIGGLAYGLQDPFLLPWTSALAPVYPLDMSRPPHSQQSLQDSFLHFTQPTVPEKPSRAAKSYSILHSPDMIWRKGVGGISELSIYLFTLNKCHWSVGKAGQQ